MRSKRAAPTVVIDTNVLYAADDLNDSLCQKAPLEQIESVKMGKERIALDKQGYILEEYTRTDSERFGFRLVRLSRRSTTE
jgi:hypothetical protein